MPSRRTPERVALVLDAGGARSAYQVGALEVLLPALAERGQRPTILVGTSAGALLSAALTSTAHLDADAQVTRLRAVLDHATKENVIQPLWRQVPEVALRYASETLGLSRFRLRGIFGTEPLARTLDGVIDWEALHTNLAQGRVESTTVIATGVRTGRVTLFSETAPGAELPDAPKGHHLRWVPTRLGVDHLMASAAIPALFPSVHVEGPDDSAGWYVDGATRRRFPLAPAVDLGADRVLVIGTGSLFPAEDDPEADQAPVDLGDGVATLLGSVMDDPLRHDLRRLATANALVSEGPVADRMNEVRAERGRRPYREVPYAAVVPERGAEISRCAMEVFRTNHGTLKGTLGDPDLQVVHRILGSDSPLQGELLSYLMFDPDFFDQVAAFGKRDAERWLADHPDLWTLGPLDGDPDAG
ncbi:patatin [Nocardioides sp. HDW12B]|uniref:patatin-like phospholipase family protein n=1 Tax=Nocardioides sp. HDW12B TaxID=2714939 RepID=UPI0014089622|nr:patatin-like phospholipase family protein [Nocardioides sp. HDW12B]QIK68155.1 patatin [Nocardioides sp. HDW12B]